MDQYILKLAYDSFQIPCYYCKGEMETWIPQQENSPYAVDHSWRNTIWEFAKEHSSPELYAEQQNVCCGVFVDDENGLYIFGPFTLWNITEAQQKAYWHVRGMQESYEVITSSMEKLVKEMALVYHFATGREFDYTSENAFLIFRDYGSQILGLELEEYEPNHNEGKTLRDSWEIETYVFDLVRRGDVEKLNSYLRDIDTSSLEVGTVALDAKKDAEYLIVILIALSGRAAIDGGMKPSQAYRESDVYLKQLAKASDLQEIYHIGMAAQRHFTCRVREEKAKQRKSLLVEECKTYVAKKLKEPLKVSEISEALEVSRSYLTQKFKKEEGVTIQQFIVRERCEHAANMLKYSQYPISVIAEYYCFSSQSHFGAQFKKYFGMTPREYREQNAYYS